MRLAIIDYGAGNLTSVRLAFETLGCPACVTRCARTVRAADRVVFPGVGAARAAMQNLCRLNLRSTIWEVVRRGTPFLGICLGSQIIFDMSEEDGGVKTLGLLRGIVRAFRPRRKRDKVPHMGWNDVRWLQNHPLLEGIPASATFYFVHSYYPRPADRDCILGETEYAGLRFASMVARGNVVATQFHPEKSGRLGLRVLQNFLRWNPPHIPWTDLSSTTMRHVC